VIRVLLADDQALVRAGFRALLDAQDDIEVVGEAGDGDEAARLAARLQPDVVLMDIRMPGTDGLAASGFLVKDTEPVELLRAVRAVADGDALLSPGVTRRLIGAFATHSREAPHRRELDALTDREREVMALVAEGLSNDEIAERLYVSPMTAKTHVSRAMTKLAARDRAQLVVYAYESGLVRPGWID
jgi:DNA-binding NarL/FixJ family response regulator